MKKYAILSTFDKTGILELARFLVQNDWEIISSGGTARVLKDAGLGVIEVSDFTGFPEILDGRVKTLHPRIHAGILARKVPEHEKILRELNIPHVNLVVVNLYPFLEISARSDATFEEKIEMIDIGGPTMIRAAAKNHEKVTVVCDPTDYEVLMDHLSQGEVPPEVRRAWAAKVFRTMSIYDQAVAQFLEGGE